jgi:hypothetical protein
MAIPTFALKHIAAAARRAIQSTIAHGINVARPDYFSAFGMESQPLITALNNTPNLNAQGWQIVPAGGGASLLPVVNETDWMKPRPGRYVVTVPPGLACRIEVNGAVVAPTGSAVTAVQSTVTPAGQFTWSGANSDTRPSGSTPIRIEFDYSGRPGDTTVGQEGIYWQNGTGLLVTLRSTDGAAHSFSEIKFYHVDDEADVLAGRRWSQWAVNYYTPANPKAPLRLLELTYPMQRWVSDPSHIPAADYVGPTSPAFVTGTNSITPHATTKNRLYSPETLAELGNRANRDIWVCLWPMATDATLTHFFTRLFAALNPGLRVYVEFSNEWWNGAFTQNSSYLEYQYTAAFSSGNANANKSRERGLNTAHGSLRSWAIAESIFGRSRVVRVCNAQGGYYDMSRHFYEFVDPGFIQAGARAGDLCDYIAMAGYFYRTTDEQLASTWASLSLPGVAPQRGTDTLGANFAKKFSLRSMFLNKHWIDGPTNGGNAKDWQRRAFLNGIDYSIALIQYHMRLIRQAGYTNPKFGIYEWHSHDDEWVSQIARDIAWPGAAGDPAWHACTYNSTTGEATPANLTPVAGYPSNHASIPLTDMFETGDIVRCLGAGQSGNALREDRTFKVRITASNTLRFYATNAAFAADTPITGASGTNIYVVNVTRHQALFNQRMDYLLGSDGQEVWDYWCQQWAAQEHKIDFACLFVSGIADPLTSAAPPVKPWTMGRKGLHPESHLSNWWRTRP